MPSSSQSLHILVTSEVSKLERSSAVKEEQPENIQYIFVTFEVSKLERSSDVKDEQPRNILVILTTSEVLKYSNPSMLLRDSKQLNQ